MQSLANEWTISAILALAVAMTAYAVLVNRNNDSFTPLGDENSNNRALKWMSAFSGEVYNSLPAGTGQAFNRDDPRIERLLTQSGNPWKLTVASYKFLRISCMFLGLIVGSVGWFAMSFTTDVKWWMVAPACALFGFFVPGLKYRSEAKQRDFDFKKQLPDALDLIIISISEATFADATRMAIPNMDDGVLKQELQEVIRAVDTGRTMDEALQRFGERAPNDSIMTFVQSLRQANELNTPINDVLLSRSEASREEYFSFIQNKTASLSSKMMAILTPTLLPALLIMLVTPQLAQLMENF